MAGVRREKKYIAHFIKNFVKPLLGIRSSDLGVLGVGRPKIILVA